QASTGKLVRSVTVHLPTPTAEAKLLRAIFHFDMSSWIGDIIIAGDDEEGVPIVFQKNDPRMNVPRNKCADVMKWVADQ
ncbi:hypothetical protein PZH42_26940, partial [Bacteroides cellulosilyticus]